MSRTIEITVPANRTENLIAQIQQVDGIVSMRVQRGVSIQPPGDVLTVETTNRSLHPLMQTLYEGGIGQAPGTSVTTSEPTTIVTSAFAEAIVCDTSEATWEEMETVIAKESNMTLNSLLLMAISGVFAAVGLATSTLHYVIAAMVVAPGFEPIVRISLGLVTRSRSWRRGLVDSLESYAALIAGAAATAFLLRLLGQSPLHGQGTYLPAGILVSYWTSLTVSTLLVTIAASVAGALLIMVNRSVLTAGVMIALALIPSAALVGMALVAGDWNLLSKSLLRWTVDSGAVLILSAVVFAWKQVRLGQRKMML